MMVSSELFLIHYFTAYCCNLDRKHDLEFLSVAVLHEVMKCSQLTIPVDWKFPYMNTKLEIIHP